MEMSSSKGLNTSYKNSSGLVLKMWKNTGGFYDPGMFLTQYSPARDICSVHVALIQ
jgi:hypothetical protein